MMRNKLLSLTLTVLLSAVPAAYAGHGGLPVTYHTTYEFSTTLEDFAVDDPAGVTHDGQINTGAARFLPQGEDGRPAHMKARVPDGVDAVQASIVDDLWGPGVVAGFICTDEDENNVCGEQADKGEVQAIFCGDSPIVSIPASPNWDYLAVYVSLAPWWQLQDCDPNEAPTGALAGGVINPNAGIFTTFH